MSDQPGEDETPEEYNARLQRQVEEEAAREAKDQDK
jgi:hypothetical protein